MAQVSRRNTDVGPSQLSYLAAGPEHGEVVVCLHGIPTGAELWRDVLSRLGDAGYHALAPDLPGYGHTRVPESVDRSLAGGAELVANWIRTHELGPVWLVAHDLGGAVAQMLVTRWPEHVARLTIGNAVFGDNWPVTPIAIARAIARTGAYPALCRLGLVPDPYARWQLRRAYADRSRLTEAVEQRVFWDGKVHDERGRREFAAHLTALDNAQTVAVADDLAEVDVPVLLLWGADDPLMSWSPEGERLRDAFDRGRDDYVDVVLLEDGGHFLPLERPDAYTDALLAWRQDTPSDAL